MLPTATRTWAHLCWTRWATELGKDDYNLPGYFSPDRKQRWTYYRKRAEGQNALVVNPGSGPEQDPTAVTELVQHDAAPTTSFAIADLTQARRYRPRLPGDAAQHRPDPVRHQPVPLRPGVQSVGHQVSIVGSDDVQPVDDVNARIPALDDVRGRIANDLPDLGERQPRPTGLLLPVR